VVELFGKSSIADFMVIASGRSQRQVGAMAEHLQQKLKPQVPGGVSIEGAQRCDWVLIDAGDVIVHNLEKMWAPELLEARRPAVTA
jgi:ribosome-associated protein